MTTTQQPPENTHIWAKIAHVSDLHFGAGFDLVGWTQLVDFLARERPGILVVSGDVVNSPWPFALALARKELHSVAARCGSRLVIVPGNHDVALWGNMTIPLLNRFFSVAFEQSGDQPPLDVVPGYAEFHSRGAWRRLGTRLRFWTTLWPWFLAKSVRCRSARVRTCEDHSATLLLVDSNRAMWFATGRITTKTVAEIDTAIDERLKGGVQPFVPRIAVLHHHPVAIAGSEGVERPTSFEPFLALRNGGTFLRILGRRHFDLVLHGHKHFAGVTRVSHDLTGADGGGVVVVAAASAGIKVQSASAKTVGIIEVGRSGRVTADIVYWGLQSPPRRNARESVALQSIAEFKRRAYLRAVDAQGLRCRELIRRARIDEFGVAEIAHELHGLVGAGREVKRIDQRFVTSIGRIQPGDIELTDAAPKAVLTALRDPVEVPRPGYSADMKPAEGPSRRVTTSVHFATAIPADESVAGHICIRYVTHNAFLLSHWEADQHTPSLRAAEDEFGARVSLPTERLTIEVRLPQSVLGTAAPQIRCSLPPSYPRVDIEPETGQLSFAATGVTRPAEPWVDLHLTEAEGKTLVQLADGAWRFQIEHPLVGASYHVYWDVRAPWEREDAPRAPFVGRTKALRRKFVEYSSRAQLPDGEAGRESTRRLLEQFRKFLADLYRPAHTPNEKCSLTLHVYDERQRSLIVAESVRNWPAEPSWKFAVPLGDGIAGSCFKQGRVILYVNPSLKPQGATKGWTLLESEDVTEEPQYQALLAIPLFCPQLVNQTRPDPEATVGVMTFASTALDSGLLELDAGYPSRESEVELIFQAAQAMLLALP